MSKHPTEFNDEHERTVEDIAVELSIMRYDRIAIFLETLQAEIAHQAQGDAAAGRTQLASLLVKESEQLAEAASTMKRIWTLCEPHMKDSV